MQRSKYFTTLNKYNICLSIYQGRFQLQDAYVCSGHLSKRDTSIFLFGNNNNNNYYYYKSLYK